MMTLMLIVSIFVCFDDTQVSFDEELAAKSVTKEEFQKAVDEHFKQLDKIFLMSVRMQDDAAQAKKGQPSLTNEDTGTQYKVNHA